MHEFYILQVPSKRSNRSKNAGLPGIIKRPEYGYERTSGNLGWHQNIWARQFEKSLGHTFNRAGAVQKGGLSLRFGRDKTESPGAAIGTPYAVRIEGSLNFSLAKTDGQQTGTSSTEGRLCPWKYIGRQRL